MAQQTINLGAAPDDGTGDTLRVGGDKINDNFDELYDETLKLKGSTDCSTNPNYPAALKGDFYRVSVAGKIGGASGIDVEVRDAYYALADNAGGDQATVGTSWDVLQGNVTSYLPLSGGTLTGDLIVPDQVYDATNWDGNLEVPTKNAVRDKIESLAGGGFTAASPTEVLTGTDSAKGGTPDSIAALWEQGSDIASAGTISFGEGGYFNITGTTTITDIDFGTDKAGRKAWVQFAGILTLTHNASTLILPTGANITTAAGDTACFVSEGADAVRCVAYSRASGAALVGGGSSWGNWTELTFGSTSTILGLTDSSLANETATAAATDRIEIEAEIEKAIDADAVVGIRVGSNGYYLDCQGDNNVVLYRYTSGAATSLSASGANATYDYSGTFCIKLVVNVHAASNNYLYAMFNDQRQPTTLNINNASNDCVGTVEFFVKGTTIKRARARVY